MKNPELERMAQKISYEEDISEDCELANKIFEELFENIKNDKELRREFFRQYHSRPKLYIPKFEVLNFV